MLEINPHFRLSSEEALKSKIFDKIREPVYEQPCPIKIQHEIHATDAWDYDKSDSAKYKVRDYKMMLIDEV